MRPFITAFFLLYTSLCFGQKTRKTAPVTADSGKNEFKRQANEETPDYSAALRILTNQVKLNPDDAELHYFLGYAIDRLNAEDGKGIVLLTKDMTLKASAEFEAVNKLEPVYKGEQFLLDPYAKLTSIWGCLAESYLNKHLKDSATWAFQEGKLRGGFIEPVLAYNRQLLDECAPNSILVTYGDIITVPIWYLQTIENYRADVTVVDVNLLNAPWYPRYLKAENHLKMSYNDAELDTLEYVRWKPKKIIISNPNNKAETLSWVLNPTYAEYYILKGDRILLDIFKQNYFVRDIYFNSNSDSTLNLYLGKYLIDEGLLDKVSLVETHKKRNNLKRFSIDPLNKEDILKSTTTIQLLGGYRWSYFTEINKLIERKDFKPAKVLLDEMKEKFALAKLPYTAENLAAYVQHLTEQIENSSH